MGFVANVSGVGSFGATVDQQSALLASMAAMGPKGDKGDTGGTGATGPQGPAGDAATIAVGTTSTLAPGASATVANSGTSSAAVFNFGIPEGEKGDKGDTGDTGPQGPQGIPGVVAATAPIQYNSGTQTVSIDQSGFLLKADNLTGLASVSTARTNLGLGTIATASASDYYLASNPSGFITSAALAPYLTTSSAAATYYLQTNPAGYVTAATAPVTSVAGKTGAVSLAVADISGAAPTASPTFTGTPSLPTGTIAVTQTAGNNTTAVATTAFVQQEVPAASTTTAGKVELATDAEAQAGTSETLAVTPKAIEAALSDQDFWDFQSNTFTASTSGTGAGTAQTLQGKKVDAPTTAAGYGILYGGIYLVYRGGAANTGAFWGKRYSMSFRCNHVGSSIDSASVGRVLFGKGSAVTTPGLSTRGFGIEYSPGNALKILAHNGTSLTTYSTSHTVSTSNLAIDVTLTLAANGTVECFVNGSSVGSTSGGPTSGSTSAGNAIHIEAENTTTITGTRIQFIAQGLRLHAAVS